MRIIDADTLKESVSNSPLIDFDDYYACPDCLKKIMEGLNNGET